MVIKNKLFQFAVFLLIAPLFCSCDRIVGTRNNIDDKKYSIVVIDGCEYIECDYGVADMRVYSLTHKGNCSACSKRIHEYLK